MLPHLAKRPLTLHLKPKGPFAQGVYIKDMEGRQPACAELYATERKHAKAGKRSMIDYLVCNNLGTLLYMVNLGCIDINPWTSRTLAPDQPDFIVIDLDPSDEDFKKAIEAARTAKAVLDRYKLKGYPKTSGKTGIHIFIPCTGFMFDEARTIAELLCRETHALLPKITTTNVSVSQRGTKLYLDPNQNDYTDTVACAYSVRPFKEPNVSTPLTWSEIKPGLSAEDFTMERVLARLKKSGDLFRDVLDAGIARTNTKKLKALLIN
jgi:bifunctional non-homologous end joining protein LigD